MSEGEKDYSDDEEEVKAKIRRKQNKKNKKMKIEENMNNITTNTNSNRATIGHNDMINAPYSSENLNKSKKELDKQMDIFVNNAMNMNLNPFSSPFDLNSTNQPNIFNLNNNTNNQL